MYREAPAAPRWTFIFIAAALVGFAVRAAGNPVWLYGAFFPAFAPEMPWTFLTAIFLHGDFQHLFFNVLALFFFGLHLERLIGSRLFLLLFLTAGVIGNVGYLATAANPLVPAIGASGAVYGVMGALAVLTPLMLVYIYGFLPVPMAVAALLWGLLDYAGLFVPSGIAHGAHLAGLVVGAGFGVYLRRRWRVEY